MGEATIDQRYDVLRDPDLLQVRSPIRSQAEGNVADQELIGDYAEGIDIGPRRCIMSGSSNMDRDREEWMLRAGALRYPGFPVLSLPLRP